MARFARACRTTFVQLAKQLEEVLGPDTAELGIRIGLHSGPITAGVLRGQRARYQLFGDVSFTAKHLCFRTVVILLAHNLVSVCLDNEYMRSSRKHW